MATNSKDALQSDDVTSSDDAQADVADDKASSTKKIRGRKAKKSGFKKSDQELIPTGKTETKLPVGHKESDTDTEKTKRANPIVAIIRFFQQVATEMRKVVWISRRQTVVYTLIVLAFLIFMVALVAGLDYVFTQLVAKVLG